MERPHGAAGRRSPRPDDSGATSSILSINLLGKFSLHVGDHEIELLSRKTKALLGYLALTETQEERRKTDRAVLERSTGRAGAGVLRQALHEIRNGLQPTGFDGFPPTNLSSGSIGRGYAWI